MTIEWKARLEMIKENPYKASSQDITSMATELIALWKSVHWMQEERASRLNPGDRLKNNLKPETEK